MSLLNTEQNIICVCVDLQVTLTKVERDKDSINLYKSRQVGEF